MRSHLWIINSLINWLSHFFLVRSRFRVALLTFLNYMYVLVNMPTLLCLAYVRYSVWSTCWAWELQSGWLTISVDRLPMTRSCPPSIIPQHELRLLYATLAIIVPLVGRASSCLPVLAFIRPWSGDRQLGGASPVTCTKSRGSWWIRATLVFRLLSVHVCITTCDPDHNIP